MTRRPTKAQRQRAIGRAFRPAEEPPVSVWKDSTSRSQRDPQKPADSWAIELGPRLIVTVHPHIHFPGQVFVSCHAIGIEMVELDAKTEAGQKLEALEVVLKRLEADAHHVREAIAREVAS